MDISKYRPEILCVGSAGIKGLAEIGAAYYFWSHGCFENIQTYIGSSAGALLNMLLLLGFNPIQILEYSLEMKLFNDLSEVKWAEIPREFGLVSNSTFDDLFAKRLTKLVKSKCKGKIPTLKEFYNMNKKNLIFVTVSLREEKAVYKNHISDPNLDLITVLRMSSNSPIVFGKLEYDNDMFSDGGLTVPYPINKLDDGTKQILGIGVQDRRPFNIKDIGFMSYYDRITSLPLRDLTNYAVANSSDMCYNVIIPVSVQLSMIDTNADVDKRLQMFTEAYKFTENLVKTKPPIDPVTYNKKLNEKITKTTILTCLKSNSARLLLKAMKQEPQLFKEALLESNINLSILSPRNNVTSASVSNKTENTANPTKSEPHKKEELKQPESNEQVNETPTHKFQEEVINLTHNNKISDSSEDIDLNEEVVIIKPPPPDAEKIKIDNTQNSELNEFIDDMRTMELTVFDDSNNPINQINQIKPIKPVKERKSSKSTKKRSLGRGTQIVDRSAGRGTNKPKVERIEKIEKVQKSQLHKPKVQKHQKPQKSKVEEPEEILELRPLTQSQSNDLLHHNNSHEAKEIIITEMNEMVEDIYKSFGINIPEINQQVETLFHGFGSNMNNNINFNQMPMSGLIHSGIAVGFNISIDEQTMNKLEDMVENTLKLLGGASGILNALGSITNSGNSQNNQQNQKNRYLGN